MAKSTKKAIKTSKPVDAEWGVCDVCGALSAWPGADVACDNESEDGEECDGTYIPSDKNGKSL